MKYKTFKDKKISLMGLGCMRFPTLRGQGSKVDFEKAEAIIDAAYQNGVNYFDTAYVYNDGDSEAVLGKVLGKYPRDSYYLATKLPPWGMKNEQDVLNTFKAQLDSCRTDYFDFYLCHNLNPATFKIYSKGFIIPALEKLRAQGLIKHLGFSSHAPADLVKTFLDAHDKWDFVLLQLNYLDWNYLDMKSQYDLVTERGLPVMVMEPVRGGKLASLCPEADALLKAANPNMSIASWAMRWAMTLENVQVILSGVSNTAQLKDNLETISNTEPLSDSEQITLKEATALLLSKKFVPCTLCNYCTGCPEGLDIPKIIDAYNDAQITGGFFRLERAFALPPAQRPKNCTACGSCIEKCPQNIDIPAVLSELSDMMVKGLIKDHFTFEKDK